MIEDIEELTVDAQLYLFGELECFGQIQVAPEKIGAAQCVPAQVAELAVPCAVAARAGPGARIDGRNKRVRVQPLDGSRLGHARN